MERVTISLDDKLLEAFDAYTKSKGYENRSEAIRDLVTGPLGVRFTTLMPTPGIADPGATSTTLPCESKAASTNAPPLLITSWRHRWFPNASIATILGACWKAGASPRPRA